MFLSRTPAPLPAHVLRREKLARDLRDMMGPDPVSSRRIALTLPLATVFAILRELEGGE